MKVLFLMFAFPDMEISFNMYTSLVEEFNNNGNEVFIVAPSLDGTATKIRVEKGIRVLRVKTFPIKNVNNVIKGISNRFITFPIFYCHN